MKPYYSDSACTIYHGDCREIMPFLPKEDCTGDTVQMLEKPSVIITDPPYGMGEVLLKKGGDLEFTRSGTIAD